MHTYFLPGVYHYLATHSEIRVTATTAAVASVLLLSVLLGRECARALRERAGLPAEAMMRGFAVTLPPLLFVVAVAVVERFRLLA